jgi:hypothetical protein
LERTIVKQKVKLKAAGKKYYQNTHGKIYRVKAKPKNRTISEYKKENRRLARLAAAGN